MKRSQRQRPSRSELREARQHEIGGHMPSFAVRRPVLMDERQSQQLHNGLRKGLKKSLPGRKASNFDIIPPQEWSVAILEKTRLEDVLRKGDRRPTVIQMNKFAALLRTRLREQIADIPSVVDMPLGRLDRFGKAEPQRKIGVVPDGWRGQRARYAGYDNEEGPSTLGVLVAENQICIDALSAPFAANDNKPLLTPDAAATTLTRTPHVEVLINQKGVRDYELNDVSEAISSTLPSYVTLGDPVIYLYSEPEVQQPYEITVRSSSPEEMIAEDPNLYKSVA